MAAVYILARNLKEAHAFARGELGLRPNRYRIVTNPGVLRSIRGADLHLVPGWERRLDRHSLKMALRWTRMNVIEAEAPEVEQNPEGDIVPISDEEASAFFDVNNILPADIDAPLDQPTPDEDTSNGDNMLFEGAPPAPEPEEPVKTGRRRSRCKECGVLHFKGDPCVIEDE